jgi:hypothetical protein
MYIQDSVAVLQQYSGQYTIAFTQLRCVHAAAAQLYHISTWGRPDIRCLQTALLCSIFVAGSTVDMHAAQLQGQHAVLCHLTGAML